MRHVDLIIIGGTVLTMDGSRRVLDKGALAVHEGRIVAVGHAVEIAREYQAERQIDASGKVVMPGMIDVHAHAGHGLIKTMGMEQGNHWEEICNAAYTVGSTPEFWFAEARLAALERLRFGVTTGVSLLGGGDTIMRTDDVAYGSAHCEGVAEIGTRSVVAVGPTRPPHPRTYASWHDGKASEGPVTYEEQLIVSRKLLDMWHGRGRLNIALLTPVLRDEHQRDMSAADYEAAVAQTKTVRALSREAGVVFTQDGHWKGSVSRAETLGILGPDALLSHAIDITPEEIRIIADTGTRIAHNPSAIASILGRCPAIELIEAGAVVAIGSDATAPDRSADMFRHMQQCMHYHRTHFRDPSVLPPGKALEMVTIDAATALGLDRDLGSLEVGKKADIVVVDMMRPHLAPYQMPIFRLAYFANGNDVDTVVIDGQVLLEGGRPLLTDLDEVVAEADRQACLLIERMGLEKMIGQPHGFFGHARYPKHQGDSQ
ncbi:amidohydrolase family protein [Rhizobium sp. 'Codium 1']|uniref:amidohydrolase family protein n=1 Tax=Rhizobium sp. 'Codium 1' TaxID=2940484 RepID=UPI001E5E17DD|nr:amidohydrolase family protein [Rhizobium sp. 'Codium 1']MCC8934140.1 amidohydrolase family protein [Rhizobium sp. 'Codium 1']